MKIKEDKKVLKQLKKIQPQIRKKYDKLIKELKNNGTNTSFDTTKLLHDKSFYRIKLDYSHRVAIKLDGQVITVVKVATRENFNYTA